MAEKLAVTQLGLELRTLQTGGLGILFSGIGLLFIGLIVRAFGPVKFDLDPLMYSAGGLMVIGFGWRVWVARQVKGRILELVKDIEAEQFVVAWQESRYAESGIDISEELWQKQGRAEYDLVWLAGQGPHRSKRELFRNLREIEGSSELARLMFQASKPSWWLIIPIGVTVFVLQFIILSLPDWGLVEREVVRKFLSPLVLASFLVLLPLGFVLFRERRLPIDEDIHGLLKDLEDDRIRSLIRSDWRLGRIAKQVLEERCAKSEA